MAHPAQIARAAALIQSGGVVAFPTETVYGLGANALNPEAIARIYEIKQRPSSSPLIVHVSSVHMAKQLVTHWPLAADQLAAHFWPGPLTLVLPKSDAVPFALTAGLATVGLRMPNHPVALALIEQSGLPIAAPSANRFMGLSPTTAEHVAKSLGDRVDLILDAGPSQIGIESTVLSLAENKPILLRPGMISQAQIEAIIGPIALPENTGGGSAHPSPGLHERHYAPLTPLYLVESSNKIPNSGRGVYLYLSEAPAGIHSISMPNAAAPYAELLYSTLHRCDEANYDWIAVETPPRSPGWAGIHDRLLRASFR